MKRIKKVMVLLMALCLLLAVGCGNKKELTLGETKDNVYTNEYFGLEAKLPEGWVNLDRETIDEINKAGNELVANGDEKKKEQLDKLSEKKALTFLMQYKYELGSVTLNPGLTITSEKLSFLQGINSGEKYLGIIQEQLKGLEAVPYTVSDEIVTKSINDVEWSLLEASIDLGNGSVYKQEFYCVLREGYAVLVNANYTDEDGKEEMEQFIQGLKINKK
ncbi:hypothetical protein [Oceanirhabdus sp. W0125-5]|uniref:hypothetical protein n=1 Tax=Oceanirhabdus sp. W0125-5 TaxID=2999116 RepID=UPI0022F33022|nr:hypothetical protein [Oceanirhabdus sp. W0125-5]WBW97681.1 hypothetical protein OW730_02565 [Oceanirhabdus sp. W0125-5]